MEQLDDLGVRENDTVRKAVKKHSTERVENTIALFRQRKREGYIEKPNGFFMDALKENWAGENAQMNDSLDGADEAARFRYWFDMMKELGHFCRFEKIEGDWLLYLSPGVCRPEKYSELREKWTLDLLRKRLKASQ